MIKNSVSIEEFRVNLADLVGRVMYGKNRVIIKKYNRDAAILLSVEDYEELLDPTKRLNKSEWDETVENLENIRAGIPEFDPGKIQKEVNKAVTEIRTQKKNNNA